MNFYNEHDPKAAAWLRELIRLELIPAGDVDERSITEIKPHELNGYTQCHFFAGIGGWSLAFQLAGIPSTRPLWTGSCPCQPFSAAGKGLAQADERHLWPAFFNLIRECRPERVFGEQVASAIGKGWLDGISADLGEEGYACGSAVLGAHSVGAPHQRQRLYWMAYANGGRHGSQRNESGGLGQSECDRANGGLVDADGRNASTEREQRGGEQRFVEKDGGTGGLADAPSLPWAQQRGESREGPRRETPEDNAPECAGPCGLGNSTGDDELGNRQPGESLRRNGEAGGSGSGSEWVGDTSGERLQRSVWIGEAGEQGVSVRHACECSNDGRLGDSERDGLRSGGRASANQPNQSGHWSLFSVIPCRDGKLRRIPAQGGIEPLLQRVVDGFPGSLDNRGAILNAVLGFPLSEGIRGRVPLLKGYGNAIVPEVAAEFILASLEALEDFATA